MYPSETNCLVTTHSLPIISELSCFPTVQEVTRTINNLKISNNTGGKGVPAKLLKYGRQTLCQRLHQVIQGMWREEVVPQQRKDTIFVSFYKRKFDRAIC